MGKTFGFLVFLSFAVFLAGFISGYFFERSSIAYTKSQLDELRLSVENMQIQELFISGEQVDCKLMFSTMGSISYNLYDMVNRLKETSPETEDFYSLKRQADFLSLRAWIISKKIRENCKEDFFPILFIYSVNNPDSAEQDAILQNLKGRYEGVLVYAIDFYLDEPAIRLVIDAYGASSAPSMIINNELYGKMSEQELESLICESINCTQSI